MSSTTRGGDSIVSALPINSRLIAASQARFFSWVSNSLSNHCSREVGAAPRSQIFSEPTNRNVGSCESRSGSSHPQRSSGQEVPRGRNTSALLYEALLGLEK